MLKNIYKRFMNDESGAVTVDWVVLTAAIVALGGVAYPLVSAGVTAKGNSLGTAMGVQAAAPAAPAAP